MQFEPRSDCAQPTHACFAVINKPAPAIPMAPKTPTKKKKKKTNRKEKVSIPEG